MIQIMNNHLFDDFGKKKLIHDPRTVNFFRFLSKIFRFRKIFWCTSRFFSDFCQKNVRFVKKLSDFKKIFLGTPRFFSDFRQKNTDFEKKWGYPQIFFRFCQKTSDFEKKKLKKKSGGKKKWGKKIKNHQKS